MLKLGIDLSQATVAKHMVQPSKPPSQSWRMFLENHVRQIVSVDFVVPTVNFRILYVFLIPSYERRRGMHLNLTDHPTAEWAQQQLVQAFPYDTAPQYLLRDHDGIYGESFRMQAASMGINDLLTVARSPWQSPYVEPLIGSIRRECLEYIVVLGEESLRRTPRSYIEYYHDSRCHLGVNRIHQNTEKSSHPIRA